MTRARTKYSAVPRAFKRKGVSAHREAHTGSFMGVKRLPSATLVETVKARKIDPETGLLEVHLEDLDRVPG